MKPAFVFLAATLVLHAAQEPRVSGNYSAAALAHAPTDERIRAYERLLERLPGSTEVQQELVGAYLQKLRESGNRDYLDRASKLVNAMLEKDGGSLIALRYQNEIDLQLHDFRAVAQRARDMAQYAPSDPGVWGNLGDASMELGDYESARQAYTRMFGLRPNLASYNRLAYFYFVTGQGQTAIEVMRNAVQAGDAQPENVAWCWAELGDMYFKLGKLNEAFQAYQSAIVLFPALHRASAGLAKVEAERSQLHAAIKDYERAQSIVPLVEYASALEDLYAAVGVPAKAKDQKDLIETIEKLGAVTNERTNRNLALALADHDVDVKAALDLMQAEIPVRGDVYTWDALAWVLYKNGRLEQARAASVKALKLGTPEPLFYYHASKIALAAGDKDLARTCSLNLRALNSGFDISKRDFPKDARQ